MSDQGILRLGDEMAALLEGRYARVERVGNTSITVHVEVFAERNPAALHVVKVTEANLTYVAIDNSGQPRAIPKDPKSA